MTLLSDRAQDPCYARPLDLLVRITRSFSQDNKNLKKKKVQKQVKICSSAVR